MLLDDAARPRPGLLASLRIQLAELADVDSRARSAELAHASVVSRIHAAEAMAAEQHLLLVVWSDEPMVAADGSQEAVLYAVGQRAGRALLEVVRVPGGEGPDMDRTLAIKVSELVAELASTPTETSPKARLLAPASTSAAATEASAGTTFIGAQVSAGALAGSQPGSALGQWGASVAAGPMLESARLRSTATLGFIFMPSLGIASAGSSVHFSELSPELTLSLARRIDSVWLGVRSGVAYSFISASGRTAAGASAGAHTRLASWLLGIRAEVPIAASLSLQLGIDLQTRLLHQRFAVNGRDVADLGGLRPLAYLALSWASR